MNPSQELELLNKIIDELIGVIEEVLQSGEVLSDEIQGMLADEIEITVARIAELEQEISQNPVEGMSPTTGAPAEKLKLERPFPSSNVHSFGYDPKNQKLYVKFQGTYPQQNGSVYSYQGVPKQVFDAFRKGSVPAKTKGHNAWGEWWVGKSPSLGAALSALIKNGGYNYAKLS